MTVGAPSPFSLLLRLYGDDAMSAIFSESASVDAWARVEVALANAQAQLGVLDADDALDIAEAAASVSAEPPDLWTEAANVGYPILSLVRAIDARTGRGGRGRVHWGATTQDIMDSALALQLRDASDLLAARLVEFGGHVAVLVDQHRGTVMAGRTHAQQAVPITLGMKFAVLLGQIRRALDRLAEERPRVAVVSLFGAAGTSAALGADSPRLRRLVGEELGLEATEIPWHVARDGLFALAANAVAAAEVSCRLAREIIDLSRTEIAEVLEPVGRHRGASSTMPQKANPILSEAIVGFSGAANGQLAAMGRAIESGHERSAGEWQIEWHVLPQILTLASSAILRAAELADGLVVDPRAIADNLEAEQGLLMAEAYMIALSHHLGREVSHDQVTAACEQARAERRALVDVLMETLPERHRHLIRHVAPHEYIGVAEQVCEAALAEWGDVPRPIRGGA